MRAGYMTLDGKFFADREAAELHEELITTGLFLITEDGIRLPNDAPGKSLAQYACILNTESAIAFCKMYNQSLDTDFKGILIKNGPDWDIWLKDMDINNHYNMLALYLNARSIVDKH